MNTRNNPPRRAAVVVRLAGAHFAGTLVLGAILFPATASAIPDTDNDGIADSAETSQYKTDPNNPDTDGDGLSDGEEAFRATNPLAQDTDGDDARDSDEVFVHKTDPKDTNSRPGAAQAPPPVQPTPAPFKPKDSDGDGIPDGEEIDHLLNPFLADSDFDGVRDLDEFGNGTDPRNPFSN